MKLNAAKRKAMPKSEFAGPGTSFPINDETHAKLAIGGATRAERAGNISASEEAGIKSKARAKLHGSVDGETMTEHHLGAAHMRKSIGPSK